VPRAPKCLLRTGATKRCSDQVYGFAPLFIRRIFRPPGRDVMGNCSAPAPPSICLAPKRSHLSPLSPPRNDDHGKNTPESAFSARICSHEGTVGNGCGTVGDGCGPLGTVVVLFGPVVVPFGAVPGEKDGTFVTFLCRRSDVGFRGRRRVLVHRTGLAYMVIEDNETRWGAGRNRPNCQMVWPISRHVILPPHFSTHRRVPEVKLDNLPIGPPAKPAKVS
jgi:hypothetical protein